MRVRVDELPAGWFEQAARVDLDAAGHVTAVQFHHNGHEPVDDPEPSGDPLDAANQVEAILLRLLHSKADRTVAKHQAHRALLELLNDKVDDSNRRVRCDAVIIAENDDTGLGPVVGYLLNGRGYYLTGQPWPDHGPEHTAIVVDQT